SPERSSSIAHAPTTRMQTTTPLRQRGAATWKAKPAFASSWETVTRHRHIGEAQARTQPRAGLRRKEIDLAGSGAFDDAAQSERAGADCLRLVTPGPDQSDDLEGFHSRVAGRELERIELDTAHRSDELERRSD